MGVDYFLSTAHLRGANRHPVLRWQTWNGGAIFGRNAAALDDAKASAGGPRAGRRRLCAAACSHDGTSRRVRSVAGIDRA